jgi:hypothetical protein
MNVPDALGPEDRAPDSIQFNLIDMESDDHARAFADAAAARGRQGAGLRPVDRQRARLLELELHSRRAPRPAADPRHADARLRRPPARTPAESRISISSPTR